METFVNLLSSEELQKLRKQPQTIPQIRGRKENVLDISTDIQKHEEEINGVISKHIGILKEERITRKGSLAAAKWNSQCSYAEVTTQKGSYWKHFGRIIQDKLILHPEETLFLVEQGNLELYHGGVPLSLQQAFSVLLHKAFSLNHYLVYAYLLRLGYMVIKHQKKSTETLKPMQLPDNKESSIETSCSCSHDAHSLCNTPLVQPKDATSTSSILSKLQVVKPYQMDTDIQINNYGASYTVDFDVYLPSSDFKKSDPGIPAFCISVCRSTDDPPPLAALNYLAQQCHPAPLKFALIADGTITITSLLDVEVPTYSRDKA